MGVAGLTEIKRRIKSVENTKKLTKAMGLVATSKLKKSKNEILQSLEFTNIIKDTSCILSEIIENEDVNDILFKPLKRNKTLYIILSSEVGLCGGYNNNVIEYFRNRVSKENISIFGIGQKGINNLKKFNYEVDYEFIGMSDIPTDSEIMKLTKNVLNIYKNEVDEVICIYTKYISAVKQVVSSEKLLPIESNKNTDNIYVASNISDLTDVFGELYLSGYLYNLILNAKSSEFSYRMIAMDTATENAVDIQKELSVKYNRARQTIITQEISEIVGGAEAQR